MPRRARERPEVPRAGAGWTVAGRPWPLPFSPFAVLLLAVFVVVVAAAWYFEGRYETTPQEAARQVIPYRAQDVEWVEVHAGSSRVRFHRDAGGSLVMEGATPTPAPDAGPAVVTLSPSARMQSIINQLAGMRIDRVLLTEPSRSPEYGLDAPAMTLVVKPARGEMLTLAIGGLTPDRTAYYVRREHQGDTVLVTRYTLDDLIAVANELLQEHGAPS